jgi:hypothetical protein
MLIDEAVAMITILDGYPSFKTGVTDVDDAADSDTGLSQNYPNPFHGSTTISFKVMNQGQTALKVHDLMGREVAVLFDGFAEARTTYTVDFDGTSLPEGVYIYTLQSGNEVNIMKKMIITR